MTASEVPMPLEDIGASIDGRYELEAVLGRGGMGAVYRVRDVRTGRCLALKRGFARNQRKIHKRQALLEREYYTLAQLAHPRIIEVYDYGIDERGPYYTMELLDGADLERSHDLHWRDACALLRDVASSLAILHARGLVHCDVSARNVRRTANGRAKLIDFGAMAPAGVVRDIVGTAPFMAPEVLLMQALDARADLFSLGALAYYLLTQRHAYPARRIAELRDVWRSRPAAPERLAPEIPAALGQLVSSLIALDRGARPQSAAEVMQRLCAIAGLAVEEHAGVSRSYLATPTLVGREQQLIEMRKRLLSLARGDGGTVWLRGATGTGRSRLLDAGALDAKLFGAGVVRADAGDAAQGDFGVARTLAAQLFELYPERAAEAAALSRGVLGHVIDELSAEASAQPPSRSLLLRELRDFFLALPRGRGCVCVIDDFDRIDEPSAALIAAIADKIERRPLLLLVAVDRDVRPAQSAALQLLHSLSQTIEVEPLPEEQTEALLRSVFGDVNNLALCARRIHALAQGQPRAIMQLAQHLVDRGLARYEAGTWSLPARLSEGELPSSLTAALQARLAGLGADARELCEALCIADRDPIAVSAYARLTAHGDARRVFGAIDELVAAGVLQPSGHGYRVNHRGYLPLVLQLLPDARRAAIHSRIADVLAADRQSEMRRAEHLLDGGRESEAIELLRSIDLLRAQPALRVLERALESAERLGLPARTVFELRVALLDKAVLASNFSLFREHAPAVLARLERESGLSAYRELCDVPAGERLARALGLAHERYLATPEHERVYAVTDAIRELGRLIGAFSLASIGAFDLEMIESLPSIEPLLSLSPALCVVHELVKASADWVVGRYEHTMQSYERVLARIAEPDRAGLDDVQHTRTRLGLHLLLGLVEASAGIASAAERAAVLDTHPTMRVSAWRVRQQIQLGLGNTVEARKCMRRAEVLHLQEGVEQYGQGSTAAVELVVLARAGDLLGVKSALETVSELAERLPNWRPVSYYGQAAARKLEGDLPAALEAIALGLALAPPGRHWCFVALATLEVEVLRELGRGEEALERGLRNIEICDRIQPAPLDAILRVVVAQVLAAAGEHERAIELMQPALAYCERRRSSGLLAGRLYEGCARVALAGRDTAEFQRFAELCAREYLKSENPVLSARFSRLLEDGRRGALGPISIAPQMVELASLSETETEHAAICSRMLECTDRADRARCALTMLLQSRNSHIGYLYGLGSAGLELLCALPDATPAPELASWLAARLELELELARDAATTETESPASQETPAPYYLELGGARHEALFLFGVAEQKPRLAAALVVQVLDMRRQPPDRDLHHQIASLFLELHDVEGIEIEAGSDTCTE